MKKDLSIKELAIMGGALFSMHFGAACMLFPVQWGKDAGTALWPVFAGVVLSGVLLPYFGYLALVKGNGTFLEITKRISPEFGTVFAAKARPNVFYPEVSSKYLLVCRKSRQDDYIINGVLFQL